MSIQAAAEKWVPLTPEIFDRLYAGYVVWIDDLTEIRERLAALREERRIGWKPSPDLTERLDDLNERDGLYAAKHMDTARAFLDAAETDVAATKPHRMAYIERLKERIAVLEKAFESWHKRVTFPKGYFEHYWAMTYGMRFHGASIHETEIIVTHFEAKLLRLEAHDRFRGLNQKPKMQLGLKLLGKKGRR
jgi:hypothetical protein